MTIQAVMLLTCIWKIFGPYIGRDTNRPEWNFRACARSRRSQWPRGLRHEPTSSARTLGSWVRIPLEEWMFVCVYSVCVVMCVRRADPPSKESYRLCIGSRNWKSGQGPGDIEGELDPSRPMSGYGRFLSRPLPSNAVCHWHPLASHPTQNRKCPCIAAVYPATCSALMTSSWHTSPRNMEVQAGCVWKQSAQDCVCIWGRRRIKRRGAFYYEDNRKLRPWDCDNGVAIMVSS
jgi:hypothetical protein